MASKGKQNAGINISLNEWWRMRRQLSCGTPQSSLTDMPPCNKSDIVIQKKKSDRCQIIDVAITSDYNIQKKATEKMSKYVDLQIECQRLWNKKVGVIPVIIGVTGIVDKNIKKNVGRIPGCHNIYNLQRSSILRTAHILRKVLLIKPD